MVAQTGCYFPDRIRDLPGFCGRQNSDGIQGLALLLGLHVMLHADLFSGALSEKDSGKCVYFSPTAKRI